MPIFRINESENSEVFSPDSTNYTSINLILKNQFNMF